MKVKVVAFLPFFIVVFLEMEKKVDHLTVGFPRDTAIIGVVFCRKGGRGNFRDFLEVLFCFGKDQSEQIKFPDDFWW